MQRPLSRVISPSSSRVYIDLSCERATSRGSPSVTDPSPTICITVLHLPSPHGPLKIQHSPTAHSYPPPFFWCAGETFYRYPCLRDEVMSYVGVLVPPNRATNGLARGPKCTALKPQRVSFSGVGGGREGCWYPMPS